MAFKPDPARRMESLREHADAMPEAALFGRRQHPGDQPIKVLLSYWYFRGVDVAELSRALTTENGPPLIFADCGAYSANSIGVTIELAEYATWLRTWMPYLTTYVNLDVIGDHEATAVNQRIMEEEHGLAPIPVVHGGTSHQVVDALCERYPYVALGGMVTKNPVSLRRWLIPCFRAGERYGTVFHGFGQTRLDAITELPWHSVDSSSWGGGHRFGVLTWWDARAHRIAKYQLRTPAPSALADELRRAGVPVDALNSSDKFHHMYAVRAAAWAWWQQEAYLRRRHGPVASPRLPDQTPGLHLYLVDGQHENLRGMLL